VSCALWSMCIEYVGTSDGGTGFPNIAECFFRWSQSSWAMQSWDLRPQIEADSKGPWMYVSRCEILSHFLKGTNLWRAAYEADVSNGWIRLVSEAECGYIMSNMSWYWSQNLWFIAFFLPIGWVADIELEEELSVLSAWWVYRYRVLKGNSYEVPFLSLVWPNAM
jgi:hypothetical protein